MHDHAAEAAPAPPEAAPATSPTSHARALDLPAGRKVWLLGTAHVSRASVEEAKALIAEVRPKVVAIELCASRYAALTDPDRWKKLDIFQVFREGRSLLLLANLAIGAWQRRIGAELGVEPGAEMLAAAEAARAVGARVELIDRDIQATLKRTWGTISLWQKASLLGAIGGSMVGGETVSADEIESMKQSHELADMLSEFTRVLPQVAEPLIYERDRYMASHLLDLDDDSVVAVVGAAHVPGMVKTLEAPPTPPIVRADLHALPKPSILWRIVPWIIPFFVATALLLAWRTGSSKLVGDLVWIWVGANFVPAALLAAAAGAKPLSVLVAGIASPITSLNPMIGAAMVVGPVEAWLRKPTVEDCERIADDVQSFSGLYRNPFTRVLLVAAASSMGSAIGAWIAGAWMFGSLSGH